MMLTKEQALTLLRKPLAEMTAAERKLLPQALKLVGQLMAPAS